MTPTIGTGPFGDQSTEAFGFAVNTPCDHALYLEDSPRRLQVEFNDGTCSRRVSLLHGSGLLPVYRNSSRRAEHHLDDPRWV